MLSSKSLQAKDVMNTDLLTLHEDTPIKEALLALDDYAISGAPVVNNLGECVGVFSSMDVVKRDAALGEGEAPRAGDYFSSDPFSDDPDEYFPKEDYDDRVLGRDTVGQWMTGDVRAVPPDATLEEVCRRMLSERVHRVLVMKDSKLLGIISTFDVVKLVAGGQEPAKPERRRSGKAGK